MRRRKSPRVAAVLQVALRRINQNRLGSLNGDLGAADRASVADRRAGVRCYPLVLPVLHGDEAIVRTAAQDETLRAGDRRDLETGVIDEECFADLQGENVSQFGPSGRQDLIVGQNERNVRI